MVRAIAYAVVVEITSAHRSGDHILRDYRWKQTQKNLSSYIVSTSIANLCRCALIGAEAAVLTLLAPCGRGGCMSLS
jgi:hypothetical protein